MYTGIDAGLLRAGHALAVLSASLHSILAGVLAASLMLCLLPFILDVDADFASGNAQVFGLY